MRYRAQESEYQEEDEKYGTRFDEQGRPMVSFLGFTSYEDFVTTQQYLVSHAPIDYVRMLNQEAVDSIGSQVLDTYQGNVAKITGLVLDARSNIIKIRNTGTKYQIYRLTQ